VSPQPPIQSSNQTGRTLGTGRDLRRRVLLHHVPLALASVVALVVLIGLSPSRGGFSISQAASPTGDVALVLLAVTLLIGPANLMLRRRNPVNNYLRRDVGTWTAIFSVVHVIVGFQGHGGSVFGFVDYFVADGRPLTNSFGLGNWTGLAATVIVVGLLVVSTDRYLRELKARHWKDLQRLNYTLFALVLVHGVAYQVVEKRDVPFVLAFVALLVPVVVVQLAGYRVRRATTKP